MTLMQWTHPSVRELLREAGTEDPVGEIERRARELSLEGLEGGWSGPPFDPFELAEHLGVEVVAREDLPDARLISPAEGGARIEFNPSRRTSRVRFSVAHELGHMLFSDHGEQPRHRGALEPGDRRADEWQLEMLCNVAAAELLMPVGAFPPAESEDLSLPHLLDLRARFGVSTEALLRRVVKLTERPTTLFAAARADDGAFRIDYSVPSRAWEPSLQMGHRIPAETILNRCTAVGYSASATEQWFGPDSPVVVQAVGIPPYPGDRFPRVVGLLQPADDHERRAPGLRYVRGDATDPQSDGPVIIAHVVNHVAQRWGGQGFAVPLMRRYPNARNAYAHWATDPERRRLGEVHLAREHDGLWIGSMVAQAGFGEPGRRPRLRLSALRQGLERLAALAQEHGASVHMPLIGTGQGGAPWAPVRDLITEELLGRRVSVTVYVLPQATMPQEEPDQLSLEV